MWKEQLQDALEARDRIEKRFDDPFLRFGKLVHSWSTSVSNGACSSGIWRILTTAEEATTRVVSSTHTAASKGSEELELELAQVYTKLSDRDDKLIAQARELDQLRAEMDVLTKEYVYCLAFSLYSCCRLTAD
jgi:hypothetical protein